MIGVSAGRLRAYLRAGVLSPEKGTRGELRFSFQDLLLLRKAEGLVSQRISPHRVRRALKKLRERFTDAQPLTGVSLGTDGPQVVVHERGARWQAESGQYLLAFEGDPASGALSVIEPATPAATAGDDAFEHALALESTDRDAAIAEYRRAIAADAAHLDAQINLGLLLHEAGRLEEARNVYARALEACGEDAPLLFNLGVLLEDMGRIGEAMDAYRAAVRVDDSFADAHYNLALLCREAGRDQEAIRHMAQYRRLTAGA